MYTAGHKFETTYIKFKNIVVKHDLKIRFMLYSIFFLK